MRSRAAPGGRVAAVIGPPVGVRSQSTQTGLSATVASLADLIPRPTGETDMRIAVLGTGTVGRTVAGKLSDLGHDVVVGTRDRAATLARSQPDAMGNPAYPSWQADHPQVR